MVSNELLTFAFNKELNERTHTIRSEFELKTKCNMLLAVHIYGDIGYKAQGFAALSRSDVATKCETDHEAAFEKLFE